MILAIPYEMGLVFQHFGHTKQFKLITIEDSKITKEEIVPTGCAGHGALAGFLSQNKVDVLICGGIGAGAKDALSKVGIKIYAGVTGGIKTVTTAFINNTLVYDNNKTCNHHHEEGHDCGSNHQGCSGN